MDAIVADPDMTDDCPDIVVTHHDLFEDAELEADREKWIKSEQAGYDLGDEAKKRWVREHWHSFVRSRLFEHLNGQKYFKTFGKQDFGLLKRGFKEDQQLLDSIVEQFKAGHENLNVIQWAHKKNMPIDRVLQILVAININRCRIYHTFDQ